MNKVTPLSPPSITVKVSAAQPAAVRGSAAPAINPSVINNPANEGRPSPDRLRELFHQELLDFGPALVMCDVRGQITKGIQCLETVCGDPDGLTPNGPKIYTTVSRPRTIGLRIGRKF